MKGNRQQLVIENYQKLQNDKGIFPPPPKQHGAPAIESALLNLKRNLG
jgi:hypothetical protein